tara:strand:+ start:1029 stop:1190 length:162 start_codon:yes stop_codon:yes gene_type:complete
MIEATGLYCYISPGSKVLNNFKFPAASNKTAKLKLLQLKLAKIGEVRSFEMAQ